jgi:formylglycine-generating enzyme required for sulfatase activity
MYYFSFFIIALFSYIGIRHHKKNLETPPGTVKISETLYMDQNPVTNGEILEYLYYLENDSTKWGIDAKELSGEYFSKYYALNKERKDSLYPSSESKPMWVKDASQSVLPFPEWMDNKQNANYGYYLLDLDYQDFPAIGISPGQAAEYCRWKTLITEHQFKKKSKKSKGINYRLPTDEEWKQAYSKLNKDKIKYNTNYLSTNSPFTHQVSGARKFNYIRNNISEILQNERIIGSNWKENTIADTASRNYTNPSDYIGFRCVCEVEKK